MAMTKTTDLSRVNINLPTSVVNRVKEYAVANGLNTTSAYVVLLNKGLEQNDLFNYLPKVLNQLDEAKKIIADKQPK